MKIESEWVKDESRLNELIIQWQSQKVIALDTEFVRTRTFFPIIGLLQVADSKGCYLIDPLAIKNRETIKRLLEDPETIKVLHACSEDAEIFVQHYGAKSVAMFDTQIAAGVLDIGFSIGYANLAHDILDVEIPKEETRSNWLQRPLSEGQMEYATRDVFYLYRLYQKMAADLETIGRKDWVFEDTQRMIVAANPLEENQYYLKIRQGWQLRGEKLWLLQQLAKWREAVVKDIDIPRSRLLKDATLFEIAQTRPNSIYRLRQIRDIQPKIVSRHGEEIIALVMKSSGIAKTEYPERIIGPIKKEASYLVVAAKEFLVEKAEHLNIPGALISKKKDLEKLIVSGMYDGNFKLPEYYFGWRHDHVGLPLMEHLKQLQLQEQKS